MYRITNISFQAQSWFYVFKCIFPWHVNLKLYERLESVKKDVLLVTDNRPISTKTETLLALWTTVPLAFLYKVLNSWFCFVLHVFLGDNTIISTVIIFIFLFFWTVFAYLAGNPFFFFFFFFKRLPFHSAAASTKVLLFQSYSFYKYSLSPWVPLPSKNQNFSVAFISWKKINNV